MSNAHDESQIEADTPLCEVIDLYPTITLLGPCQHMSSVMLTYTLTQGRLSVDWSLDQIHEAHVDYVKRACAVKAAKGHASRVLRATTHDRFRSITHLIETLKSYDLLPAWLRVVE